MRSAVNLYWLPLGAGGSFVRLNGRLYEAAAAWAGGRRPQALYHSALEIELAGERYVVEMAPVWNERTPERGVVVEGPVGSRRAGRTRLFRYEVRRWRDGRIPDIGEAVDSPRCVTTNPPQALAVLRLVPEVPPLVWGRDELGTGDMWNSNSVIAWLIARAGVDAGAIRPPPGGRAPGWWAGVAAARQSMEADMQKIKEAAAEFLAERRVAVTGVSRNPKGHGGNVVYQRLRSRGYEVFAVNPNAEEVEGDHCFHDLHEIRGGVDAVLIATSPEHAEETMRECVELGVKHVWMHQGPGAGSVSERAAEYGREHGVAVIDGGCPCMFGPTADPGHKMMRAMLTVTHHIPRRV